MSEPRPKIITVREMGYGEALDCHTAAGKRRCDWCKKPATYFVRQSVTRPGFHVSISPKCVACMGLKEPGSRSVDALRPTASIHEGNS